MKQIKYQLRYALPVWFTSLLFGWLPDNKISIKIRGYFISLFLPGRPKNLTLGRDITFLGINTLFIGNNVYIAKGCWLNALGTIEIKDDVMLAPYCVLATTRHTYKNGSFKYGKTILKKIIISQGAWVSAHCTITQNVTVGKSNIIAANSVVVKDTKDFKMYAGVPAKEIKDIEYEKN